MCRKKSNLSLSDVPLQALSTTKLTLAGDPLGTPLGQLTTLPQRPYPRLRGGHLPTPFPLHLQHKQPIYLLHVGCQPPPQIPGYAYALHCQT